jgi:hypothetical protein
MLAALGQWLSNLDESDAIWETKQMTETVVNRFLREWNEPMISLSECPGSLSLEATRHSFKNTTTFAISVHDQHYQIMRRNGASATE